MLQLMITFIWFGYFVPQDYMIKLGEADYPVRILLNPPYNTSLQLRIQKADRYRLQILRNGGVYADMDTTINYTCLMKKLQQFDGEILVMNYPNATRANNNFIYVPQNRTKLINEILDNEKDYKQFCKGNIVDCNGPAMINGYAQKYKGRIKIDPSLEQCVRHQFDWSWYEDSNKITKWNLSPYKKYQEKKIKKKDIIIQRNELLEQVAELQEKLNSSNSRPSENTPNYTAQIQKLQKQKKQVQNQLNTKNTEIDNQKNKVKQLQQKIAKYQQQLKQNSQKQNNYESLISKLGDQSKISESSNTKNIDQIKAHIQIKQNIQNLMNYHQKNVIKIQQMQKQIKQYEQQLKQTANYKQIAIISSSALAFLLLSIIIWKIIGCCLKKPSQQFSSVSTAVSSVSTAYEREPQSEI